MQPPLFLRFSLIEILPVSRTCATQIYFNFLERYKMLLLASPIDLFC